MEERIVAAQVDQEDRATYACIALIEAYASTLTNYIKENGNGSLGTVTNDVMALESLISEVNRFMRF